MRIASGYERAGILDCSRLAARSSQLLPTAIPRRNHSPILTRARQPIKHTPGGERDVADGFFSVPLAMQVCRHDTEDEGTLVDEDHARIVAHAFERAGLIGNLQIVGEIARDPTVFVGGEDLE